MRMWTGMARVHVTKGGPVQPVTFAHRDFSARRARLVTVGKMASVPTGFFGDGSCSCAPPNAWNGETCVLPICDSDPEIANIDGANSPCEGTFWGSSCSFQCAKGFEPKGSALCEAGGWLGGICSDINECLTGQATCSPNGFCANNEGGFSCSCNGGYEGDGETCTNINECETLEQPCGENANCADTPEL